MAQGFVGVLWAFIWLLVLVFISFIVGFISAIFYVIILPLTPCIKNLKDFSDQLLKGAQLPHFCVVNMLNTKSYSEATSSRTESAIETLTDEN